MTVQKMRILGLGDYAVDESGDEATDDCADQFEDMEDHQLAIHIGMSTVNLCIYSSCILYSV